MRFSSLSQHLGCLFKEFPWIYQIDLWKPELEELSVSHLTFKRKIIMLSWYPIVLLKTIVHFLCGLRLWLAQGYCVGCWHLTDPFVLHCVQLERPPKGTFIVRWLPEDHKPCPDGQEAGGSAYLLQIFPLIVVHSCSINRFTCCFSKCLIIFYLNFSKMCEAFGVAETLYGL